jgi:hypothetical protein
VSVSVTNPGAAVTDLSTDGTLDWVHFGFQGTTGINRKRSTAAPLILMSVLGAAFTGRSSAMFSQFVWSDGTPVMSARNVQSAFETTGATGGFQITVQGEPTQPRILKLFVGSAQGAARLTARFGELGAPVFTDSTLGAATAERNRLYTIIFQPPAQTRNLVLAWTIDGPMGNVRLQAVSLAGPPAVMAPR